MYCQSGSAAGEYAIENIIRNNGVKFMEMKKCPSCGKENRADAVSCEFCEKPFPMPDAAEAPVEGEQAKKQEHSNNSKQAKKAGFVIEDGVLKKYKGRGGNVTIPEGVTSIGRGAFCECKSLKSVSFPAGITAIGDSAFAFCRSLSSVVIPDGVTGIGKGAFYKCSSLSSVTVPASVTGIGSLAFNDCPRLTIHCTGGSVAEEYAAEEEIKFVLTDGSSDEAAHKASEPAEDSFLGDEFEIDIQGNDVILVKYLGEGGTVVIPDGVTLIGEDAFRECLTLRSVSIPASMRSIGYLAFYSCQSLSQVTFSKHGSLKEIGEGAFSFCEALKIVRLPDSLSFINENAFGFCKKLSGVSIPPSVKEIGVTAFSECPKLTVYCVKGSFAEEFANNNSIKCETIKL
jgi:hypothetical protein